MFSHYSENVKKLISFFENQLENIDFLNLDDFKKVSHQDLMELMLSKKPSKFEIEFDISESKTIFDELLN